MGRMPRFFGTFLEAPSGRSRHEILPAVRQSALTVRARIGTAGATITTARLLAEKISRHLRPVLQVRVGRWIPALEGVRHRGATHAREQDLAHQRVTGMR
jgi:hypothetical protein